MIRIFVSRLVLPDKLWSIGLFIEFVDDEGLRRPVAWTFCSTADASVAFRLPFVTPDFPLRASTLVLGSLKLVAGPARVPFCTQSTQEIALASSSHVRGPALQATVPRGVETRRF